MDAFVIKTPRSALSPTSSSASSSSLSPPSSSTSSSSAPACDGSATTPSIAAASGNDAVIVIDDEASSLSASTSSSSSSSASPAPTAGSISGVKRPSGSGSSSSSSSSSSNSSSSTPAPSSAAPASSSSSKKAKPSSVKGPTVEQERRRLGDFIASRLVFEKFAIAAVTHFTVPLAMSTFRSLIVPNASRIEPASFSEADALIVARLSSTSAAAEVFGASKIRKGSRVQTWSVDLVDIIFRPQKEVADIWWTMG